MNKTKSLIISGSIIIGVSFLLAIYFILIALGVIQTRSNKVIIETASLTSEYDGSDQYARDFKIIEGELLDGHSFDINYIGYQRDIGSSLNTASVKIIDDGLNDVTSNYELEIVHGSINITKRRITFSSGSDITDYNNEYLINDEYQIISGKLMEGDYFSGESTSSIYLPGSIDNTFIVNIYNSENKDATHNYEITYEYGRLEVKKVSLTIASLSNYKVYDGEPIEYNEYEFGDDIPPFAGIHDYKVTFNVGRFSDVGQIENSFYLTVYDKETGLDVTNMYDITYEFGTLTIISSIYDDPNITNKQLDYAGKNLLTAESSRDENIYLRDVSYGDYLGNKWGYSTPQQLNLINNPFNFVGKIIANDNPRTTNLKLDFNKKNSQIPYLTPYFTTENRGMNDLHNYGKFNDNEYKDYEVNYMNYNYLDDGFKFTDDALLYYDIQQYTDYVNQTYLKIDEELRNSLLDIANRNDIFGNTPNLVGRIKDYIENIAKYDIEFDEFPDSEDYILYFLEHAESGIAQHFASAAVLMYRAFNIPARYVTGYFSEVKKGVKVDLTDKNAHAWVEVFIDGMGWVPVEVTNGFDKIQITIKPIGGDKIYDGLEFSSLPGDVEVVFGELLEGHYIEITTKEKLVDATNRGDQRDNYHIDKYYIYDEDGNDVTKMYRVETEGSRVNISKRMLIVQTGTYEFVYNGENQSISHDDEFMIANQVDNHYASNIEFTNTIRNVGSVRNKAEFIVLDLDGKDVTKNYNIIDAFGTLRVTPKLIEIAGKQIIKSRNELENGILEVPEDAYEYVGDTPFLDDIDKIIIKATGSIDYVGEKVYEIKIEDPTGNYTFDIVIDGIIKITP